jgi:hypothetical protein
MRVPGDTRRQEDAIQLCTKVAKLSQVWASRRDVLTACHETVDAWCVWRHLDRRPSRRHPSKRELSRYDVSKMDRARDKDNPILLGRTQHVPELSSAVRDHILQKGGVVEHFIAKLSRQRLDRLTDQPPTHETTISEGPPTRRMLSAALAPASDETEQRRPPGRFVAEGLGRRSAVVRHKRSLPGEGDRARARTARVPSWHLDRYCPS